MRSASQAWARVEREVDLLDWTAVKRKGAKGKKTGKVGLGRVVNDLKWQPGSFISDPTGKRESLEAGFVF